MRCKTFTLLVAAALLLPFNLQAQSPEGSTGWETLQPAEALLLEENFQGFPFFHSDENPDQGNSTNEDFENPGYKDTASFVMAAGASDTIFYDFYQCAFAPEWVAAYAYKDAVDMPAGITSGFVEISREYESHFTVNGHFIIDLRQLEFVEVVQWAHSSCGGNKRGFTLDVSTDNGVTWDTLRMQTGNTSTSLPQPNSFNVQESAFGMRWEDGVWDFNVMLRFTQAAGQAVRIHDLKVYGIAKNPSSTHDYTADEINIVCVNRTIRFSTTSDIGIYDLGGTLLRRADNVDTYGIGDLPDGIYIVRARTDSRVTTRKVLLK